MTSNDTQTRYQVVLPSSDSATVLAICDDSGYSLPAWSSSEERFWEETLDINQGLRDLLGVSIATLRGRRLEGSRRPLDNYYVVELLDPDWSPPAGAHWIDAAAVEQLHWRHPTDQAILIDWFNDRPSPTRVGWYQPGWFASARCWIEQQITAAGLAQTGEVEQLRSWERSSIMRVDTDEGRLYFKAVARQWGHEPGLTTYLGERFPQHMPSVVAAEPSSGRMLIREFAGKPLPKVVELASWEQAYTALGAVQRALIDALPALRHLGVPYRDLNTIAAEIPAILSGRRRMRAGMEGGLTDAQIAALQAAEPALLDACRRLAQGPIPLSLDHGDFWPGNMFADPVRVTLFDWSDSAITHPFFSLVMAADEIAGCLPDQPDAPKRVVDAYLAEWSDYASMEELRAIFDDAMLVAPLHLAMMYGNVYIPAMEFVDELDRMTPHFLRWLVGKVGVVPSL